METVWSGFVPSWSREPVPTNVRVATPSLGAARGGAKPPSARSSNPGVLAKDVERLVEGAGCELLFLPPYSPDMNPIEEAFSKVKGILRKAGARTREALVEATGRALDAITCQDIRGFYADCGYHLSVQSL